MTMPELTLAKAKQSLEQKTKTFRASDFLTTEEVEKVKKSNARGKKRKYNEVDAYIAEIISRFGYETYIAWKKGEIDEDTMMKYVLAERTRDIQKTIALESIIIAVVAGANNPTKNGHAPKSLKLAINMLKKEQEKAKGDI